MAHYPYLIVGGGMTAAAAARALGQADSRGPTGLISAEPHPPYNRPPLSKGLWKGAPEEKIWRRTGEGVELHLGRRVRSIDPDRRQVTDDQGTVYGYDRLLLATGGAPRRLPFGQDGILYYRTLDDYHRLRRLAGEASALAVIGGGFIGSEIAAALAMNGKHVVMLFPEQGVGARMFPADLARSLNDYYRERGVEVRAGERLVGLQARGRQQVLRTEGGAEIAVGAVVAGIGIRPNVELAQAAGLETEDGIVVDERLRTSRPDIFAAGDVARFYNPALQERLRVEHEDNANSMGRVAGLNMAGADDAYHHLPFFYSDLFDLGYEAVGELDARLETVSDWKEPFREGVVYYLRDGRVRGVLLWNVWGQLDPARELIAQPGPFAPADLKGRLPA